MQKVWDWCSEHQVGIERTAAVLAAFVLVRRWLLVFWIWPDSSIYLTAAMNFVRHGTMFIYANYPSGNLAPANEIYADYPPGFPLFLSVFFFFLRSPVAAAVAAQAIALVGLTAAVSALARQLRLTLAWRAAALFYFTCFVTFRLIFASLLTEALYIALSVACCCFSLRALEEPGRRRWWAGAYLTLLASATVRWNGLANGVFLLFPIWAERRSVPRSRTLLRLILAGLAATAPNPVWFFRNSFYLHKGTAMHDVTHFPHLAWEKASVPFENMALRWGFGHFWIFLLVLACALSPIWLARAHVRAVHYFALLAGMLVQFTVIFLLTLAFSVTPLDDRYLSPTYAFLGLLIVYALNAYTAGWGAWRRAAPALALAGVVALSLYEVLVANRSSGLKLRPRRPAEFFLWEEIRERPYVKAATHYFTDDDFVHQIFIEKPQRLVFSNRIREADIVARLKATGTFFFVLQPGSEVQLFVNQHFKEMKQERIAGFLVYSGQ